MRVLVAHASRHGSTAEIAARIAAVLADRSLAVECHRVEDSPTLDEVDAVVLGGAVYAGSWPKSALAWVDQVAATAATMPVWVFSSGPAGDPPRPAERPAQADAVAERLAPRDHAVFAGVIDRSRLSFIERGIVAALRIPDGDYRDWAAITAWAEGIASTLGTKPQ